MKFNISLIFFIILMFFSVVIFGQSTTSPESFKIIENNAPDKEVFYTHSISKSNLENYRLKDKQVTLEFKNGFKCVLLSAKELFINGLKIDVNAYQEQFEPKFSLPIFEVTQNGWITAGFTAKTKYISK